MITFLLKMGANACFLEAVGLLFGILNLVGPFFYYRHQVLIGGGEFGVVGHQLLKHLFLVDDGGGKVSKVSFESLRSHLVAAVVRLYFASLWDPPGRIHGAKLFRPFIGLCFYARFGVRPLVTGLPVSPCFLFLGSILPVVVSSWVLLSCDHRRAC